MLGALSTKPKRPRSINVAQSRLLPLSIASIVCFLIALILGYGGWYFFGSHRRKADHSLRAHPTAQVITATPTAAPHSFPQAPPTTSPIIPAPPGEVEVPGGEITLGGGETGLPIRREIVEAFSIAETEVTNEQYREFVRDTDRKAPIGWGESGEPPAGTAMMPVAGVTWADAVDYCHWLSEKIKATVRLPTEAEWELAAGGAEKLKYPWGNEWNERCAASAETKGRISAVRSYPEGKSPYGVYDMAGNVWEWTADQAKDEEGHPLEEAEIPLRIAKGGAADEKRALISSTSRQEVLETMADPALGFRYVILRKR